MDTYKYLMPAEWEPHEGLWLAWPYDTITFPTNLEKVEETYANVIHEIYLHEQVNLLVGDLEQQKHVTFLLTEKMIDIEKILFYTTPYADVWMRDYGPLFVKNITTGKYSWIKWRYNAYGNKFPDLLIDNNVFFNLKDSITVPMVDVPIVMEGGAFEVNGRGTLITTEQCLLNPNRNPNLSKDQIENYLRKYVGAQNIIWLKEGVINDHTDGHIDDVAKFVNEHTVMCGYEDDTAHPNFRILDDAYQTLSGKSDQDGKPLTVVKLPMPHMVYDNGGIAPASYVNFYIGNSVVLVPTFNDPNDSKALGIIASYFPNRKVVGVDATDLIYGGGAIHCITQQQPVLLKK
jgi:agmatine deiminase